MKKLLLKAMLFLLILGSIKLPFALVYENELSFRQTAFADGEYTAVFIGSSRTKMSIIPALFDSLNAGETKTYNFGIEAGVPPYTFDWCENLIARGGRLKYIFFELSGGDRINARYRAPWREFYLAEYLAEIKNGSFEDAQKYHNRLILEIFKPFVTEDVAVFEDYNLPLEAALVRPSLVAPRTTKLDELKLSETRNRQMANEDFPAPTPSDEQYRARIRRLIELAEAKSVRIYFFVPPRLESDAELEKLLPVFRELDEKYKIRANHFEAALYRPEISADEFHLNHAGALRFTKNFADAFKKRAF